MARDKFCPENLLSIASTATTEPLLGPWSRLQGVRGTCRHLSRGRGAKGKRVRAEILNAACPSRSLKSKRRVPAVVAAFLHVLSRRETHELLTNPVGARRDFEVIAQRLSRLLVGSAGAAKPNVDSALAESLMAALEGMTADRWPDRVYALGAIDVPGWNPEILDEAHRAQ